MDDNETILVILKEIKALKERITTLEHSVNKIKGGYGVGVPSNFPWRDSTNEQRRKYD